MARSYVDVRAGRGGGGERGQGQGSDPDHVLKVTVGNGHCQTHSQAAGLFG